MFRIGLLLLGRWWWRWLWRQRWLGHLRGGHSLAKLAVEDGRLMSRIIENGFIVNIFFFEEWTASLLVDS
jgi:hypothetical protein